MRIREGFPGFAPSAWILAIVLAGSGSVLGQDPPAEDKAAAALAQLREGTWSTDAVSTLVGALVDRGNLFAARWWLRAGEEAMAAKQLPEGSASVLTALRRKLGSKLKEDKESGQLLTRALTHARNLAAAKARRESEKALGVCEAAAAMSGDEAALKQVAEVRKRIADIPKGADGDAKLGERLRAETNALIEKSSTVAAGRYERALQEFGPFGNLAGYRELSALIKASQGAADEALIGKMKALRSAARAMRLDKDLEVHILGDVDINVWQDWAAVPASRGSESKSQGEWAPMKLRAFPGEQIAFEVMLPGVPESLRAEHGESQQYAEVLVRAKLGDTTLPVESWQATEKAGLKSFRPRLGGILYAHKGPPDPGVGGMPAGMICMNYRDPLGKEGADDLSKLDPNNLDPGLLKTLAAKGIRMTPYSPMHQMIEERAKGDLGGFHWVVALHQNPVYVLTLPD